MWRLGRVKELIVGSDGQTRGATLDVSTNGKQSTLRRPISCLYPLEVEPKTETSTQEGNNEGEVMILDDSTSEPETTHNRPTRVAAVKARQLVCDWMSDHESNQLD